MRRTLSSLGISLTLLAAPLASGHPHADPQPLAFADQLSQAFEQAAAHIKPSVVRIGTAEAMPQSRRMRGRRGVPFIEGTGSGLIISTDGYIATNHHVIDGAVAIVVTLHDGRQYEATPVGIDRQSDLAVIRIEAAGLSPATFADPEALHIGQWVLAVGCPFGLEHSFSAGIVSATGRSNLGLSRFEHLVQTDAAINPGNSGGPLVDLRGRVIGLNAAIKSTTGTGTGVGFAIPVDMVERVCGSLIEFGAAQRGFLGVSLGDLDPALRGSLGPNASLCLVRWVDPTMPAAKAGLQAGDVIEAINSRPVRSSSEFSHAVAVLPPGELCQITYRRGDDIQQTEATLTQRPDPQRP